MAITPATALLLSALLMPEALTLKSVQYVDNYDGDTVAVRVAVVPGLTWDRVSVRAADMDSPEIRGSCQSEKDLAEKARLEAQRFLRQPDAKITVRLTGEVDRDLRPIGVFAANGVPLAEHMIRAGYARPWKGHREDWCAPTPARKPA